MPETIYTHSVATDTPNGKVDVATLDYELRRLDPPIVSAALCYVAQDGDDINCCYEDALDAGDQTALASAIGVHAGDPLPQSHVIASAHVVSADTVSGTVWADVGGVVTRPEAFAPLPELSARVTMAIQVPSQAMDLRLIERDEDQTEREMGSWNELDTAGGWRFVQYDVTGATPGTHEYVLQAKLSAGGSNGEVRSCSFSLIRTV